jgi:hypothetical protein
MAASSLMVKLFQVIDGGQANDLRIDFRLIRPDGVPMVADFGKSDTAHRNAAELDGDYKVSGVIKFFRRHRCLA